MQYFELLPYGLRGRSLQSAPRLAVTMAIAQNVDFVFFRPVHVHQAAPGINLHLKNAPFQDALFPINPKKTDLMTALVTEVII